MRRLSLNKTNLKTIPEISGDSRDPVERVPQSIIDSTPNVDPIVDNHDLLKNELQNTNSPSSDVRLVESHGDNSLVYTSREKEQDSDNVQMSDQSSDIMFEDGASKSSSNNNHSVKEEIVESNSVTDEIPVETPDIKEEDTAESIYS